MPLSATPTASTAAAMTATSGMCPRRSATGTAAALATRQAGPTPILWCVLVDWGSRGATKTAASTARQSATAQRQPALSTAPASAKRATSGREPYCFALPILQRHSFLSRMDSDSAYHSD